MLAAAVAAAGCQLPCRQSWLLALGKPRRQLTRQQLRPCWSRLLPLLSLRLLLARRLGVQLLLGLPPKLQPPLPQSQLLQVSSVPHLDLAERACRLQSGRLFADAVDAVVGAALAACCGRRLHRLCLAQALRCLPWTSLVWGT